MNNVDIILPTYNCAEYIEEAINSVIGQTLENWKLIIIDDASKDSTTSLIKNYLNDKRIVLKILKKNKGQGFCRNLALRYSNSIYVAFIDSDDIWKKDKLKKQIELLLSKVGNTTNHINNTQNIQLNSYGKEDLEHITDSMKTQLLKIPYGMIPKMIEAVHFNHDKPENKNIAFTNKKENKIKVYSNDKWIYKDKEEIVTDLIDGKYYLLI